MTDLMVTLSFTVGRMEAPPRYSEAIGGRASIKTKIRFEFERKTMEFQVKTQAFLYTYNLILIVSTFLICRLEFKIIFSNYSPDFQYTSFKNRFVLVS